MQLSKSSALSYNVALIKNYVIKSPFSVGMFFIVWVMFFIEWIMTVSQEFKAPMYGISNIDPKIAIQLGGNVPYLVHNGQIYRMFMAMFLHAGITHIAINSLSLIMLCMQI